MKQNPDERLVARIRELAEDAKLDSWSSFVEELQVPSEVYPAVVTNRPQLLRAIPPRALSADEAAVLYKLIAGLIETNVALRQHASELASLVDNWLTLFKGITSGADRIQRFAHFDHRGAAAPADEEPE